MSQYRLSRFLEAQNQNYLKALSEVKSGKKLSHWMWYVFPQLRGLGQSHASIFYGITGIDEAVAYLQHLFLESILLKYLRRCLDSLKNQQRQFSHRMMI